MKREKKYTRYLFILIFLIFVLFIQSKCYADTNEYQQYRVFVPSKVEIVIDEEVAYTGKAVKPNIKITAGSVKLREGIEYSVTYVNNINVGTATAEIQLKQQSRSGTLVAMGNKIIKYYKIVEYNTPIDNPDYYTNVDLEDKDIVTNKFAVILSVIQVIGVVVSIVTLMIIGIKYMLGSVEAKAEYKQTLLPWAVGAVLVFAATVLPKIIYNVVSKW